MQSACATCVTCPVSLPEAVHVLLFVARPSFVSLQGLTLWQSVSRAARVPADSLGLDRYFKQPAYSWPSTRVRHDTIPPRTRSPGWRSPRAAPATEETKVSDWGGGVPPAARQSGAGG